MPYGTLSRNTELSRSPLAEALAGVGQSLGRGIEGGVGGYLQGQRRQEDIERGRRMKWAQAGGESAEERERKQIESDNRELARRRAETDAARDGFSDPTEGLNAELEENPAYAPGPALGAAPITAPQGADGARLTQQQLIDEGFYLGDSGADGQFGPMSRQALALRNQAVAQGGGYDPEERQAREAYRQSLMEGLDGAGQTRAKMEADQAALEAEETKLRGLASALRPDSDFLTPFTLEEQIGQNVRQKQDQYTQLMRERGQGSSAKAAERYYMANPDTLRPDPYNPDAISYRGTFAGTGDFLEPLGPDKRLENQKDIIAFRGQAQREGNEHRASLRPERLDKIISPDGEVQYLNRDTGKGTATGVKERMPGEKPVDLEHARAEGQRGLEAIDAMLAHPGLNDSVGMGKLTSGAWLGGLRDKPFPGTDAADFMSYFDMLHGTAFLAAFEGLKGGGQITEIEGQTATKALTRMSLAQSPAEFRKAALEFRTILQKALERKERQAARQGSTLVTSEGTQTIPQPRGGTAADPLGILE